MDTKRRIRFDGLSLQAHRKKGTRLKTVIEAIAQSSYDVDILSMERIGALHPAEFNLLILTTRYPEQFAYSEDELEEIHRFVIEGGSLLLMSNHADCSLNRHDTREFDAILASRFGLVLDPTFFSHRVRATNSIISRSFLNINHPIISPRNSDNHVQSLVTRTCCSIKSEVATPLAFMCSEMTDKSKSTPPRGRFFACSLSSENELVPSISGRVVVTADSGFIGSAGTESLGVGLIEEGDNLRFVMNAISWLLGEFD